MTAAYNSCWTRFMCHHTGVDHDSKATFTQDELLSVTPEDLCAFLSQLAYGTTTPRPDDIPTLARSSTLEFYKKAISKFMPRGMIQWDGVRREGNPTKSIPVNDLIKSVRKSEVRQQGVKSAARQALEYTEFVSVLALVRQDPDRLHAKRLAAVLSAQWQLIARIDDMMKLKFCNMTFNMEENVVIFIQLRWSKNTTEVREAPEQVLLGSMDARVCVLLNLAIYIELLHQSMGSAITTEDFVFSMGGRSVVGSLTKAFSSNGLERQKPGPLGTHSFRKGAATYGSKNGLAKDVVERRGRWQTNKGVIDHYIATTLPYPDAVAAGVLSGPPGPAKYTIKSGVQYTTTAVLTEQIAPGITALLGRHLGAVLALPLVWAALTATGEMDRILPAGLKEKVVNMIKSVGGDASVNPVERVPIHVSGEGGMVRFSELGVSQEGSEGQGSGSNSSIVALTATANAPGVLMREIACSHSEIRGVKRRIEELHADTMAEISRLRGDVLTRLENMDRSLKRIAIQPITRPVEREAPADTVQTRAKLPKCPRDLYILWQEYEFGRACNEVTPLQ